ncbi:MULTISPECIES: hypothetical protein [unclassified Marinobacterium]|jgi:hypothetical protein|uniref:hypothetical protein n=1 Tax=unclassified Marinobacterium TaxID=2644139 RepID=UPI0015692362|nr:MULTISPECIES: hypothetical protein [unclassified Marinobacterium]NRP52334.1 hypothetical protein [Marinobacterium sp. xm-v-242]NRP76915.1 hypothetical protein [Marinobacterium sp. xm-m-383]
MGISLLDLVTFTEAAANLKLTQQELLRAGMAEELRLFHPSKKPGSIIFELAQIENLGMQNQFWAPVIDYDNDQGSISKTIHLKIGHPFQLDYKCIASLLLNGNFSPFDLLVAQLDADLAMKSTARSNYHGGELRWITETELNEDLNIEDVFVLESDIAAKLTASKSETTTTTKKPSDTALKVIGLLMHHLAKSPKYASGGSPNKSQIKELLLELANELDINNYRLSKVDERLLVDAMKYLETQKN